MEIGFPFVHAKPPFLKNERVALTLDAATFTNLAYIP